MIWWIVNFLTNCSWLSLIFALRKKCLFRVFPDLALKRGGHLPVYIVQSWPAVCLLCKVVRAPINNEGLVRFTRCLLFVSFWLSNILQLVVDLAKCLFHAVPDHRAISGLVPGGISKESTFSGNAQTAQWALTRLDIISKHSKTRSTMRTLSKHSHAPFILFVVVSYRNVSAFSLILKLSPSYISNWQ